MYKIESWIREGTSFCLSEEGVLRRFLQELKACRRIRHVHQEVLLGLHIAVAEREPLTIAEVAEQLRDLRTVTPTDLRVQVLPSAWALELSEARTEWIYACEESRLHDFLNAVEQTKDERLVSVAYDVAEGLAAQSTEVLSWLLEDATQDPCTDISHRGGRDSANRVHLESSQAQEKLVVSYTGYALRTAKKYVGLGVPYLDLVQEGVTGIMEAARRYSPRDGRSFKQSATTWAWQRIGKALSDQGRTIRLPMNVHHQVKQCDDICMAAVREGVVNPRAIDVLLLGEDAPSVDAGELEVLTTGCTSSILNARFGARGEEVEQLLELAAPPVPVETLAVNGAGKEAKGIKFLQEYLLEGGSTPTYRGASPVERLLGTLSERDEMIIRLYFGVGVTPLTLGEIGERVGLTRERVRQLKERALERMRKSAAVDYIPDFDAPGWMTVRPRVPDPRVDWRRRRSRVTKMRKASIHSLLSDHLDGYRGHRHDKTNLRHHLIGALREAGRPMTTKALTEALNARLAPALLARCGAVEESYVQALLRDASKVFIPLAPFVYGLLSEELSRSVGERLQVCPPLVPGLVDADVVRRAFSIGEEALGPKPPHSLSARERHAAAGVLYILGLSGPIDWYREAGTAPTVRPPTVREERAWMSGLDALTARLEAMDVFWSILRTNCPSFEGRLASQFSQAYPLALADTPYRLALLEAMGAVECDDAGRYWLTSRGGVCADLWSSEARTDGEVSSTCTSVDGREVRDSAQLTREDEERLVNTLLGL